MESDVITLAGPLRVQGRQRHGRPTESIGSLRPTGLRPTFLHKFEKRGIELPHELFAAGAGTGGTGAIAVRAMSRRPRCLAAVSWSALCCAGRGAAQAGQLT